MYDALTETINIFQVKSFPHWIICLTDGESLSDTKSSLNDCISRFHRSDINLIFIINFNC